MKSTDHNAEADSEEEQFFRFENKRDITISFCLEPWGDEYEMPPGSAFEVAQRGPKGSYMQIDMHDSWIIVWAGAGCDIWIWYQDEQLGPMRVYGLVPPKWPGRERE